MTDTTTQIQAQIQEESRKNASLMASVQQKKMHLSRLDTMLAKVKELSQSFS
ncbi:MAG: hypothetical protein WCJ84_01580 [Candidatus Peregrinibacteria bacterium]